MSRGLRSVAFLGSIALLFPAVACSPDAPTAAAPDVVIAALNASPRTSDFVVEAQNSIRLQTGGLVANGGDLGARGTTGPFLGDGAAVDALTGVQVQTPHNIIAYSVTLGTGAKVGAVQTTHLVVGTGATHGTVSALVPLPALPVASPVAPGTTNLSVATGATVSASPGHFATITVGTGGTLKLAAGAYDLTTLTLSTGAKLQALGAVQLHVAGRVSTSSGAIIGAAPGVNLTAGGVRIEISGQNGTTGALTATPPAASFGTGNTVTALLLIPNGSLVLGTGTTATGAFLARDVDLAGAGVKLTYQDGFPNACAPTTCSAAGKNCGGIPDGCGGTLDCGGCAAPTVCGGAGTPNVCGVVPSNSCEQVAWRRSLTSGQTSTVAALASDSLGNVYVAGSTWPLGQSEADGHQAAYVTKVDPQGNVLWSQQLGASCIVQTLGVATSQAGFVYVAGAVYCALPGLTSPGGPDIFVAQYDSSGNAGWVRQIGSDQTDIGRGVATDAAGNVYLVADTNGSLDGTVNDDGTTYLAVIKFAVNGDMQWVHELGSTGSGASANGRGIGTDAAGSAYVTGVSVGSFDGNAVYGQQDVILAKFDTGGNKLWSRQYGTPSFDYGLAAATDPAGNFYVTGIAGGTFPDSPTPGSLFILKYDGAGNRLWTRQRGPVNAEALAITADATGVFVSGETPVSFDGQPTGGDGDEDPFVVKFSSDGDWIWTEQDATPGYDLGTGLATGPDGSVYSAIDIIGPPDANNHRDYDAAVTKIVPAICGP